ncbi:MAG: hypothetical protein ACIAXF_03555 [Phycisphaerales bacterium JB063]
MTTTDTLNAIFDHAVAPLTDADVFASVQRTDAGLRCDAMHVEEECYYAATTEPDDSVWVGWYTPDRWLSESVEADLVHLGDKIEELLEEELLDLGYEGKLAIEHFRNDDKVFVFRSKLDLPSDVQAAARSLALALLAYQACFVELGDMGPDEDD